MDAYVRVMRFAQCRGDHGGIEVYPRYPRYSHEISPVIDNRADKNHRHGINEVIFPDFYLIHDSPPVLFIITFFH
jgi:hypothetical protein